jgi:thiol-disulfide isomerase/thioredoxin
MNKRVLVVVIILGALIAGSIAALALSMPTGVQSFDSAPTVAAPTNTVTPTPSATPLPGRYVDYTADGFPAAEGRTFLFFYAPWCGQCRDIDAGILAQGVPDGVTILKADFDSEQALEQRYGVTMRTTFVEVDADGNAVQSFVAFDTPTFDAVIAAMF